MTKKTKQVAVRMTPEMHKRLEALAQAEHRTLSGQIIHLVRLGSQKSGHTAAQNQDCPENIFQAPGE